MSVQQRIVWTQDIEAQLVELWQAHSNLYDVSAKSYHDSHNRDKDWATIATHLQLPINEVKTRVASLRTQYVKLLKPKASGSGQKTLTPKQKWILENLDFLKVHVIHRDTVSNLQPHMDSEGTCATEEGSDEFSAVDGDADISNSPAAFEDEEESSSSTVSTQSMCQPAKRQKTQNKNKEQNIEQTKLSILKQVHNSLSQSHSDSEEQFGLQVAAELRNVKDKLVQLRLRRTTMNTIYDAQESEHVGHSVSTAQQARHYSPLHQMQQVYNPPNENFSMSTPTASYRHLLNSE